MPVNSVKSRNSSSPAHPRMAVAAITAGNGGDSTRLGARSHSIGCVRRGNPSGVTNTLCGSKTAEAVGGAPTGDMSRGSRAVMVGTHGVCRSLCCGIVYHVVSVHQHRDNPQTAPAAADRDVVGRYATVGAADADTDASRRRKGCRRNRRPAAAATPTDAARVRQ